MVRYSNTNLYKLQHKTMSYSQKSDNLLTYLFVNRSISLHHQLRPILTQLLPIFWANFTNISRFVSSQGWTVWHMVGYYTTENMVTNNLSMGRHSSVRYWLDFGVLFGSEFYFFYCMKNRFFLIFIMAICNNPSPLNSRNLLSVKKSICKSSLTLAYNHI